MKNKQYIGVTGITSLNDVENMTKALDGHYGMYGILMSKKRLDMQLPERRWAGIESIPYLMKAMPNDSLRTIHWCSNDFNLIDIFRAIEITGDKCNTIQLNLFYPPVSGLELMKSRYPNMKIIFQIEKDMFENPKIMKKKIKPYESLVDYVILDQSMGAGISIDEKISRAVAEELQDLDFGLVLAGGLTANKVKDIGSLIREFNASVDAEGQLMNSKNTLDNTIVKDYITTAIDEMHNKK
ncbi:hypothetical protein GF374_00545 [Candidatus Woesearchaeota archaeon]|nr:hypothetical protein [Candidatus Woesearchaeota archaeon]